MTFLERAVVQIQAAKSICICCNKDGPPNLVDQDRYLFHHYPPDEKCISDVWVRCTAGPIWELIANRKIPGEVKSKSLSERAIEELGEIQDQQFIEAIGKAIMEAQAV